MQNLEVIDIIYPLAENCILYLNIKKRPASGEVGL